MRGAKPHLVVDNSGLRRAPAPPSWLSREAKAEWRRVLPALIERRILTTPDLGSLENYCLHIGTIRQMDRHIEEHGAVVEIEGVFKRNPAVGIRSDSTTQARLLAAELGLTPVSRSRPSVREDGDDDGLNPLDIS